MPPKHFDIMVSRFRKLLFTKRSHYYPFFLVFSIIYGQITLEGSATSNSHTKRRTHAYIQNQTAACMLMDKHTRACVFVEGRSQGWKCSLMNWFCCVHFIPFRPLVQRCDESYMLLSVKILYKDMVIMEIILFIIILIADIALPCYVFSLFI